MGRKRFARHSGWRQLDGRWVRTLGAHGARVRLFQKRRDGTFFREVWVPGYGFDRKSLGVSDRESADQLGLELLASLLTQGKARGQGILTLGELWARFSQANAAWLDNDDRTRRDDQTRAAILLSYFGDGCDVRSLTPNDVVTYAVRRRGGGIGVVGPDGKTATTRAVRARAIECDIKLLRAMLRWATTVRLDRGARRLLEQNPLDGLKLERENSPRRPVATWERFEKTRTAIAELRDLDPVIDGRGEPPAGPEEIAAAEARRRANRLRWVMLDLVLVIVEATGRRIGAVRQLQWPDIDLTRGRIRWRAATDKKRREWGTPIPIELVEEIRRARGAIAELAGLQAVQGYIFFAATDHTRAVDRDTLNSWLEKAERRAKLEKLEGGLWHPYRRAWATARKHHPLKDVAAAGGWKDVGTLLTCYTVADDETVLAVMSESRKVRDAQTAT